MEIKNITRDTKFQDILIGDCFVAETGHGRDLFLKIEPVEFYTKTWKAIRLKDCSFWPFQDDCSVKRVKAKIIYKEI